MGGGQSSVKSLRNILLNCLDIILHVIYCTGSHPPGQTPSIFIILGQLDVSHSDFNTSNGTELIHLVAVMYHTVCVLPVGSMK